MKWIKVYPVHCLQLIRNIYSNGLDLMDLIVALYCISYLSVIVPLISSLGECEHSNQWC